MTVIAASSQDADSRELRLAVVMTGGVSLAVWIGGVAGEIYRAAQGAGLYGALGQLTQTEVVVDVITGASAGGVNGAFLHTALSRELEPDRFNGLRGVWLEDGAFTKLFRPVKDRQPPSLLQGDEYFLGCLERELLAWADVKGVLRGKSAEGLRLVMTTTPLDADIRTFVDDLGATIDEPRRGAQFSFAGDVFEGGEELCRRTVSQLALAARASASFPGAFEPAFIPIGSDQRLPGGRILPDMADVSDLRHSRFVVDGGVVVNKPVSPALAAILARGSEREVRRVMLYVNPDPADRASARTATNDAADPPTLTDVLAKSLISLPRSESIAADLDEIFSHHRQQSLQRESRAALLLGVRVRDSGAGVLAAGSGRWRPVQIPLVETARTVFPLWIRQRAYESVRQQLDRLQRVAQRSPQMTPGGGRYSWPQYAAALRNERGQRGLMASEFPEAAMSEPVPTVDDDTPPVRIEDLEQWPFGLEPVEYFCAVLLDLISRAYGSLATSQADPKAREVRNRLNALRAKVRDQRELLALLRFVVDDYWLARFTDPLWPKEVTLSQRAQDVYDGWPVVVPAAADEPSPQLTRRAQQWERAVKVFELANNMAARRTRYGRDDVFTERWDQHTGTIRGLAVGRNRLFTREELDHELIGAGWGEAEASEHPEDSDADMPKQPLGRAVRRAEMLIARRVALLFTEAAEPLFAACDGTLPAGWRDQAERAIDEAPWPRGALRPDVPGLAAWRDPSNHYDGKPPPEAALLAGMVIHLTWVSPAPFARSEDAERPPRSWASCLQELFALYVMQDLTEARLNEREARIELVQVSADAPSMLDPARSGAPDKVAGIQLGHFGGFLKRSWRANDWMWGALDGADRLVRVLADPHRLRQCFPARGADTASSAATAQLLQVLRGLQPANPSLALDATLTEADLAYLANRAIAIEAPLRRELAYLDSDDAAPPTLAVLGDALSVVAQLLVARRELPVVAAAVRQSSTDKAGESIEASEFLAHMAPYLAGSEKPVKLQLEHVPEMLRRCRVGQELVAGEVGTDALTAAAAQATAVTSSVLGSNAVGLRVFRLPVRLVRYGLLGLHFMAQSTIDNTRTEAAFRNLLLAVTGVILGLSVVGARLPLTFVAAALVIGSGWLMLTAMGLRPGDRALRHRWRPLLGVLPFILLTLVAAAALPRPDAATKLLLGAAPWKVSAAWSGAAVGAVGFLVELVRHVFAYRARQRRGPDPATARRHDLPHLAHGVVWLVAAAGWLLIWHVGFTPSTEGDWGRGVARLLRSAHDVRVALVFAVPAALVAYDLLRGWIQQQRIQSQRSAAARSRDRAGDPVTHQPKPAPELVIDVRDGQPDGLPETPVAPRGGPVSRAR